MTSTHVRDAEYPLGGATLDTNYHDGAYLTAAYGSTYVTAALDYDALEALRNAITKRMQELYARENQHV